MEQIPNQGMGTEVSFTRSVEDYTAAVPSSAYLAVAVGGMALSLVCQFTGRGKWGNFIAQWVPTWLTIGIYNKVVKLAAGDDGETGQASEQLGEYVCEFCESKFSLEDDLQNHKTHCPSRRTVDARPTDTPQ